MKAKPLKIRIWTAKTLISLARKIGGGKLKAIEPAPGRYVKKKV